MTDTLDLFSGSEGLPAPRKPQQVLSFGKHKGQPYEVLLQDSGYALWLMNSMFARLQSSHPDLLAFLVGRYGVPDRTPVHNRLQNLFLDETFCYQFALVSSAQFRKSMERLLPGTALYQPRGLAATFQGIAHLARVLWQRASA